MCMHYTTLVHAHCIFTSVAGLPLFLRLKLQGLSHDIHKFVHKQKHCKLSEIFSNYFVMREGKYQMNTKNKTQLAH